MSAVETTSDVASPSTYIFLVDVCSIGRQTTQVDDRCQSTASARSHPVPDGASPMLARNQWAPVSPAITASLRLRPRRAEVPPRRGGQLAQHQALSNRPPSQCPRETFASKLSTTPSVPPSRSQLPFSPHFGCLLLETGQGAET